MSNYKRMLVLAVLLVSACAGEKPAITYTPPVLVEGWSVGMTQSGGIAGLLRTVEVQADGRYTVTDKRANATVTDTLTVDRVAVLENLIENLELVTLKSIAVCADCFVYDAEIQSGGQKMIFNVDDLTLGESGAGELVNFLRELIDAALQQQ